MKWNDFSTARGFGFSSSGRWGVFSTTPTPLVFFLDFVIYPMLIVLCLYLALAGDTARGAGRSLLLVALGYAVWTLAEYLIHRFIMHHVPMFRAMHFAHHDAPRDLIGTPTLMSVAIFVALVFWPLIEILGLRTASAVSVGLLLGYLAYVSVHYALHHWSSNGLRYLQRLKRHHALHHHKENECNFGVTTTVWDWMFGTLRDIPPRG